MRGYKVFDYNWRCRGFQYEVGKIYVHDGEIKCCECGFHFCVNLRNCFNYYVFDPNNKVAEIDAFGDIDSQSTKYCTNRIHILRELSWQEVLDLVNDGVNNDGISNKGDYNLGHNNHGNYNTGNNNIGCLNCGNNNIGGFNKGNNNMGCFNIGDSHIGFFNTEPQPIYMFNKPVDDITFDELSNTEAFRILYYMILDDVEKRQKWWDKLPQTDKKAIINMPNFNTEIFKQVTGIEV